MYKCAKHVQPLLCKVASAEVQKCNTLTVYTINSICDKLKNDTDFLVRDCIIYFCSCVNKPMCSQVAEILKVPEANFTLK